MIRLSRLTDYGVVLMSYMAARPERLHNAAEVAAESHLPVPTVSKVLKTLAREGLLISHRGTKGGYTLARPPEQIRVTSIIGALEGPIALTMCAVSPSCEHEPACPTRRPWQRINTVIRDALDQMTLADMIPPQPSRLRATDAA